MKKLICFLIVIICAGCARIEIKDFIEEHYKNAIVEEISVVDTVFAQDKYCYDSLKLEKQCFDVYLNMHSSEILEHSFTVEIETNDEYILEQIKYNKIKCKTELQLLDTQLNRLRDSSYIGNKKIAIIYKAIIKSDNKCELIFLCRKSDGTISRVYTTKLENPFVWNDYYTKQNILEAPIK